MDFLCFEVNHVPATRIRGVHQARVLGDHLVRLNLSFDAIYFGEMDRHQKTAQQVMDAQKEKGLPVPEPILDPAFNEYDSESIWDAQIEQLLEKEPDILSEIDKDPKNNRAFQKVFSRVVNRWVSGNYDRTGDATWKDFKQTVTTGLQSVMEKQGSSKTIGIFTSAGPICIGVGIGLELSDLKTIEISSQIMNASVSVVRYGGGNYSLDRFNDISHLQLSGDKMLLTYR